MIVPVRVHHKDCPSVEVSVYTILNDGSDSTFITNSTLRDLGVKGTEVSLKFNTIHGENSIPAQKVEGLVVQKLDKDAIVEVDNLLKQMSVVSGQLQQLSDTVAKFVKCKFCQKKFFKSLDDNDVSREDLATGRKNAEEYRATPPASMPTPVASSTPLAKKYENVISIQKSTDKKVDDSDVTILVGSASRGLYLSKKKVDLLSRSSPKLFNPP